MTCPVAYLDPELDPFAFERKTLAAGIALEKHFTPYHAWRREDWQHDGAVLDWYTSALASPRIDPPVRAAVVHDPDGQVITGLVASAQERIALVSALGSRAASPWPEGEEVTESFRRSTSKWARVFRLPAGLDARAVLAPFQGERRDTIYLLGDPAPEWIGLPSDPPAFAQLLPLVRAARWVLASHVAWRHWIPYCVYSREDPRALPGLNAPELLWIHDPLASKAPALPERDRPSFAEVAGARAVAAAEHIELEKTGVVSVRELSEQESLRSLGLRDCPFVHRSELGALARLERLDLRMVPMRDLEPLARLPNLHSLVLDLRPRSGWRALTALTALAHLILDGIRDLDLFELAEHLPARALTLRPDRYDALVAAGALAPAARLEALSLRARAVDWHDVEALSGLRALEVRGPRTLPPRAVLEQLRGLALGARADLASLPALPGVRRLQLEVESFDVLDRFGALEQLELFATTVAAFPWEALEAQRGLRALVLGDFDGVELHHFGRLPLLERLGLSGSTFEPRELAELGGLKYLELASLEDLEPLAALINLDELVIHRGPPAHPEALLRMPRLRRVILGDDLPPAAVTQALRERGVSVHTHPFGWAPIIHDDLW